MQIKVNMINTIQSNYLKIISENFEISFKQNIPKINKILNNFKIF